MDKWLNIGIVLLIGLCAYGITFYFGHRTPAPIIHNIGQDNNSAPYLKQAAPNFTFTDIHGTSHNLEDYKGKIIILNFWASWCAPCVKEFPDLIKTANEHPKDVMLIALSSDHEEESMLRFLKKIQRTYPKIDTPNILIARDKNTMITNDLFHTFRLPETFIIGRDFKIHHKLIGANWHKSTLDQTIENLRKVP